MLQLSVAVEKLYCLLNEKRFLCCRITSDLSFLCLICAVKQREAVRAMWTPVTPLTKGRVVALQPWLTALPHVLSPQRKAPHLPPPNHKRNTRFLSITPNTSQTPQQQQLML